MKNEAQIILEKYGMDDGQTWETADGRDWADVLNGEARQVTANGGLVRYEFADGSAIVAGDAWDLGVHDDRLGHAARIMTGWGTDARFTWPESYPELKGLEQSICQLKAEGKRLREQSRIIAIGLANAICFTPERRKEIKHYKAEFKDVTRMLKDNSSLIVNSGG